MARQIADFLLEIQAVLLKPNEPFTWASGWKSPIYCDNRLVLSALDARNYLKKNWAEAIKTSFPGANALAGVATAGIAHAALLADELQLPMAYVRSKPKEHGTGKNIEGRLNAGSRAVVIEDLISTGKSSLQAVESLRTEGVTVEGLFAIFSYDFQEAQKAFEAANVKFYTLCNYPVLLESALAKNYIKQEDIPLLNSWRQDPANWGK
ncbi:MAG: orotate phosphoribosyltransferase [Sphingobacteriales bacterium]|nr:MAG: orotate phosphoribosyltransferase [Sphingobacteriales bacterium]